MRQADARRAARAELADYAARAAEDYERTAEDNARDVEGAKDASRMAAAHRALASMLDPDTFPPPRRADRQVETLPLITPDGVPIEELTRG